MTTATKKHPRRKVLKPDVPAVAAPAFVPEHVTPAGVECISIQEPCSKCKRKWVDNKLTTGGEVSEPIRHVCYFVFDVIWPVVDLQSRDIWPVRPDLFTAWLCHSCYADVQVIGLSNWAWDYRAAHADKAWKKKRSAGVAESFRERFDEMEETWAQEAWDRSVEEECAEQLENAYGPSPTAVAIQAIGIIHREHNIRAVERELPSDKATDLRREIKQQGGLQRDREKPKSFARYRDFDAREIQSETRGS